MPALYSAFCRGLSSAFLLFGSGHLDALIARGTIAERMRRNFRRAPPFP